MGEGGRLGSGVGEAPGHSEQRIRKSHQLDPCAGGILLLYFKTIANAVMHLGLAPAS